MLALGACAKARSEQPGTDADTGPTADAACDPHCDHDHDGVEDGMDKCPATPTGQPVNHDGCADSQLTPTLEPTFPPYELVWTNAGDLGRAGGLTWTYT